MIEDLAQTEGRVGFLDSKTSGVLVNAQGGLTDNFRTQLRTLQEEETQLFEEKLKSARPADKDLFGIKRRICTVCAEDCGGYEPTRVLFGGRGEFPTFCAQCNCPAHFHKIEDEKHEIPTALTDLLTGKNIQSEDLNYNCVMAAFILKDGPNKVQTAIEIANMIKDGGIEILTSSSRYLSYNEAFFLRNRVVAQSERKLAKTLAQDFQKPSFESEIKKMGEIDSLNMNNLAQNNEFLMERLSQIKEFHMEQARQSFGTGIRGKNKQDDLNARSSMAGASRSLENNNRENRSDLGNVRQGFDMNDTINQRVVQDHGQNSGSIFVNRMDTSSQENDTERSPTKEIKFGSNTQGGLKSSLKKGQRAATSSPIKRGQTIKKLTMDMTGVFKEIHRREALMPKKYQQNFKIKYGRTTNDQRSKKFVEEVQEYKKAEFLIHALDTNPLLRQICENKLLLVVLNSSTNQGFHAKLTNLLRSSQISSDEAALLYASDNKVKAMEDCIQFSPELFRLSKSIIISEPIIPFTQQIQMRLRNESNVIDSSRMSDSSAQSEYIRNKMRNMETIREGSPATMVDRQLSRQISRQKSQLSTQKSLSRAGTNTAGTQKSIKSAMQKTQTNIYRQQVTHKKTQYHDQKALSLQKKLSLIDKVASTTTQQPGHQSKERQNSMNRKKTTVGGLRKNVTFLGDGTRSSGQKSDRMDTESSIGQADWVMRIKDKERNSKTEKLQDEQTIVQYNFGVMHDFFAYSATCVQFAREEVNLSKPICPAGILGGKPKIEWRHLNPQYANLFAIAKVGVANMILPNTLDIKLSNYEDFDSYASISDYFFPNTAKSQQTVIVLRPVIVKNGLNDLLLQIIKANEFLILKRQIRKLTKAEVAYLFRAEKIQERNSKLYYEMMMSGAAEIIVVSKISAVYDCNTLFNGANPTGRRRINYLNEGKTDQIRKNVDSVDAMFEIAPFTCFSEFIDLEDFLIRNSKIDKFRKLGQGQSKLDQKSFDMTAELLYYTKLQEIRKEVNLLQRHFNVVGYTAKHVEDASRELCIFSPSIANIQEVCLILNPMYNHMVESAIEVLIRADFTILQHSVQELTEYQAEDLFNAKFGFDDSEPILELMNYQPVHAFHLAKIAGDREMRALFKQSDLQYEDLYSMTQFTPPLKPAQIPFMFFFMDDERTYELCLRLLYKRCLVQYTGEDFLSKIHNQDIANIIQGCLLTTVGDKLKQLMIDAKGEVKQPSKVSPDEIDRMKPVNIPLQDQKHEGVMDGCFMEPQFMLKLSSSQKKAASVQYIAEADDHGLFEIRFHRLAHMGDRENSDTFPSKQIAVDKVIETETQKQVVATEAIELFQRFASCSFYYNEVNKVCFNICPAFYKFKIQPFQWLFDSPKVSSGRTDDDSCSSMETDYMSEQSDQSTARSHHEANMDRKPTTQETLLKTKTTLHKQTTVFGDQEDRNVRVEKQRENMRQQKEWKNMTEARRIMRVFEVEEHMGSEFMEELSRLHQEHLNILRHNFLTMLSTGQNTNKEIDKQRSLPAYIYGTKLAQMVKSLEEIKCYGKGQLRGAGKIKYNRKTQVLQGELPKVTQNSFFEYDRKRYLDMLDNFKGGWSYYLSILETEIIEQKLMFILDSLTFRYSRQPQYLVVQPDRVTSINLRISEKIKVLNDNATQDKTTKFFKPLSEDLIDPERELDVRNHVDSVLQTLNHSILKADVDKKLREEGTSVQEILDQQADDELKKKYSIHKDCAIAGIDAVCRRPKHHLIASILWLIDFTLRKVQRKSDFFVGDRNRKVDSVKATVEAEYDEVLDILKTAISANYGDDEINAALDVVDLKEGGYETEFERHMRNKNQAEEQKLAQLREEIEGEKRRKRTKMSLQELIETEVHTAADAFKKQQREELEQFLDMRAGLDKDGTEFMKMLERSKMHFGPYALQLAEEYFNTQMKKFEAKLDPSKKDEQEKISFVKMEYFLYGVAEANRLIEQLKSMENRINGLAITADRKDQEAETLKLSFDSYDQGQNARDNLSRQQYTRIKKAYDKASNLAKEAERALQEQRHEISAKETELLMVFRELMGFDFYVPDYFFDKEQLMRKKENKKTQEQFIVPLKTFWRPIELEEYYETDLTDKKFFKRVNPMDDVESTIGQYLAKPMRDALLRDQQAKIQKLREGGEVTALRHYEPVEKTDKIIFDKYMSHGQRRQDEALYEEKKVIDFKTAKKPFQADVPFDFQQQE